ASRRMRSRLPGTRGAPATRWNASSVARRVSRPAGGTGASMRGVVATSVYYRAPPPGAPPGRRGPGPGWAPGAAAAAPPPRVDAGIHPVDGEVEDLVAAQRRGGGARRVLGAERIVQDERHAALRDPAVGAQAVALEPGEVVVGLGGPDAG